MVVTAAAVAGGRIWRIFLFLCVATVGEAIRAERNGKDIISGNRPRKLRDFLGTHRMWVAKKCLLQVKILGGVLTQLEKLFRGGEKWSI